MEVTAVKMEEKTNVENVTLTEEVKANVENVEANVENIEANVEEVKITSEVSTEDVTMKIIEVDEATEDNLVTFNEKFKAVCQSIVNCGENLDNVVMNFVEEFNKLIPDDKTIVYTDSNQYQLMVNIFDSCVTIENEADCSVTLPDLTSLFQYYKLLENDFSDEEEKCYCYLASNEKLTDKFIEASKSNKIGVRTRLPEKFVKILFHIYYVLYLGDEEVPDDELIFELDFNDDVPLPGSEIFLQKIENALNGATDVINANRILKLMVCADEITSLTSVERNENFASLSDIIDMYEKYKNK